MTWEGEFPSAATPDRTNKLKPNAIVTCKKPWEGIGGPLQVMRVGRIASTVWVIGGEFYIDAPTLYLKEQPFMQAVYYRRYGWLKRLRPYWFRFAKNTQLVEFR